MFIPSPTPPPLLCTVVLTAEQAHPGGRMNTCLQIKFELDVKYGFFHHFNNS
jgi:hypothetical protein